MRIFFFILALSATAHAAVYVDPVKGNDNNPGTSPNRALATIQKARGRGTIYLRGGRYELKETLKFDAKDSGTTLRAYRNETPIISGGRRITGWKQIPGKPYWQASVPTGDWFWQLYVNGVRATRARSNTTLKITEFAKDGFSVQPDRLRAYTNIEDIRCLWVHVFKAGDIPVVGITSNFFKMQQPAWEIWNGWKDGATKAREFFVVNAFEELDEPGEWYLNRQTRTIYYYPLKRDDMNTAEIYAPAVECLLKVEGARDFRIEGVTFEHGQWLDPQHKLLGRSQAEIYMGDTKSYSGEVPGQIIFDHATNVVMTASTIRHMGSCGVQVYEGCHRVTIEGNTFYDTTAAGITVGRFWFKQEQAKDVPTDTLIANNIVRNTGRDYPQGTGINVFTAQRCRVYHNDVSDIAYTAIHARNGDGPKISPVVGQIEFKWNKVSRAFQMSKWGIEDGGQLYQHGRYPGSEVSENYSLYAHPSINYEYYCDNFSHTVKWTKNVSRYGHAHRATYFAWHPNNIGVVFDGNYGDRSNPSVGHAVQTNFHLVKNDNWPPEANRIMANAGLEPKWRHRLASIYGHDNLAAGKSGTMDLGREYVIQRVTITPGKNDPRSNIEVQASNDPTFKNYVVLCEQNEVPWYNKTQGKYTSNMWEQYLPGTQGYRYLRVKSDSPNGEFAAYGYPKQGD